MLRSFAPQSPGDLWPYAEPTPAAGPTRGFAALLGRLAAGILAALAAIAERRRIVRAERALVDLDDRMLRDIGITRTQIGRVVRYGRSA
jgi:uncharacterized protein YjiS (DUF1127 family)